jgi:hypothetical protein
VPPQGQSGYVDVERVGVIFFAPGPWGRVGVLRGRRIDVSEAVSDVVD